MTCWILYNARELFQLCGRPLYACNLHVECWGLCIFLIMAWLRIGSALLYGGSLRLSSSLLLSEESPQDARPRFEPDLTEGALSKKFIDWKKTKLFRFRWNWDEEKKLCGIPSADFLPQTCSPICFCCDGPSLRGGGEGGRDFVDTVDDTY